MPTRGASSRNVQPMRQRRSALPSRGDQTGGACAQQGVRCGDASSSQGVAGTACVVKAMSGRVNAAAGNTEPPEYTCTPCGSPAVRAARRAAMAWWMSVAQQQPSAELSADGGATTGAAVGEARAGWHAACTPIHTTSTSNTARCRPLGQALRTRCNMTFKLKNFGNMAGAMLAKPAQREQD